MRLNVSSAIRIDSLPPLIEGEPIHDAACGIAYVLFPALLSYILLLPRPLPAPSLAEIFQSLYQSQL